MYKNLLASFMALMVVLFASSAVFAQCPCKITTTQPVLVAPTAQPCPCPVCPGGKPCPNSCPCPTCATCAPVKPCPCPVVKTPCPTCPTCPTYVKAPSVSVCPVCPQYRTVTGASTQIYFNPSGGYYYEVIR